MGGGKVLDLIPEDVIEERDQLKIEVSVLKKDKAESDRALARVEKEKEKAQKDKEKAEKEIEQYRKLFGPLPKK